MRNFIIKLNFMKGYRNLDEHSVVVVEGQVYIFYTITMIIVVLIHQVCTVYCYVFC